MREEVRGERSAKEAEQEMIPLHFVPPDVPVDVNPEMLQARYTVAMAAEIY